ncbi:TerB N-terminal domain-containing protein [Paenibacillus wulumuqiensis]|uniref:TerB N-terminal domain-containing protein n=1 Tax=Paenibacillus wulumuqiensis TaxID=1567107 RepID=UPI0009E50640|nr:TerB N-terminal domain-containing protein [Paenibacillus wulumuqiensis]
MMLSSPVSCTDKSYIALLSFEEDRGFFLHISYGTQAMELEKAMEVQQLVMGRSLSGSDRWQISAAGHSECLLMPEEAGKLYSRLLRLLPGTLELEEGIPVQTYWDKHAAAVLAGGESFSSTSLYESDYVTDMTDETVNEYAADSSSDDHTAYAPSATASASATYLHTAVQESGISYGEPEEYIPYEEESFAGDIHQEVRWVLEGRREERSGIGQVTAVPMIEIGGIRYPAIELSRRLGSAGSYVQLDGHGQIETERLRELGLGPMGRMADGTSLDRNSKLTPQEIIQRGSERLRGPWEEIVIPELELPDTNRGIHGHFDFLCRWGISGGILGGVMRHAEEMGEWLYELLRRAPSCRIGLIGKKSLLGTLHKMWSVTLGGFWQDADTRPAGKGNPDHGALIAVPVSMLTQRSAVLPGGVDIAIYLEPDEMTGDVSSKMYKAMNKINARLRLSVYSAEQRLDEPHMRTAQTSLLKLFHSVVREYAIADPDHPLTGLPPAFAMTIRKGATGAGAAPAVEMRTGGFAEFELGSEDQGWSIPARQEQPNTMIRQGQRGAWADSPDRSQRTAGLLEELSLQGIEIGIPGHSHGMDSENHGPIAQKDTPAEEGSRSIPSRSLVHGADEVDHEKYTGMEIHLEPLDLQVQPLYDLPLDGRPGPGSLAIPEYDAQQADLPQLDAEQPHSSAADESAPAVLLEDGYALDLEMEIEPLNISAFAAPTTAESGRPVMTEAEQEQTRSMSSIQSAEHIFARRAHEMMEHAEEEAEFVPFMSYWPTYESMTWRQKKWYFYWRQEVRQGRYPVTDLSYIFLLCYEVINGAGWQEPVEGHHLLMNLWRSYRQRFSKLDRYLPQWIVDFAQVHELREPLIELLREVPRHLPVELADLEWERIWSASPAVIPFDLLPELIHYDMERSRFYAEVGGEQMREYIPKVLAAVDAFLDKQQGVRLIQLFRPPVYRETERYLFRSAVYDSTRYGRTCTIRRLPLTEHMPLREFLTGIVKLTENELRRHLGFSGRLRISPPVEPEIARLIERYVKRAFTVPEEAPAPRQVQIDASVLEKLQADSDVVRDMLTLQEEEKAAIRREQAEEALLESWSQAAAAMEPDHNDPGIISKELAAASAAAEEYEAKAQYMDNPHEYKEYNQDQDHTHRIGALDQDPEANTTANKVSVTEQSVSSAAARLHLTDELEEEWRDWAEALQSQHIGFLAAVLDGAAEHELQKIAGTHGTMAALLADEINDLAMDTIGDLLLEDGTVMEEYRSLLDAIIMR